MVAVGAIVETTGTEVYVVVTVAHIVVVITVVDDRTKTVLVAMLFADGSNGLNVFPSLLATKICNCFLISSNCFSSHSLLICQNKIILVCYVFKTDCHVPALHYFSRCHFSALLFLQT